ncbi:hypothetical protein TNCV_4028431 [Trichonephila clavipes]|nr:hypothetical protein TNCV_4028431 [Trichonephila clavipes]
MSSDTSGIIRPTSFALLLSAMLTYERNQRPHDKIYPIDDNIINTLEDFLSHLPIAPTNPDEITDYVRRLPTNKAPRSDKLTNKMSIHQETPSQSRPLHFKAQIPFDMRWRNVSRSFPQRCQASLSSDTVYSRAADQYWSVIHMVSD